MLHYEQLSIKERMRIYMGHLLKRSSRSIARELGRPTSTIIREIKRNSKDGLYCPEMAHQKALARKKRGPIKLAKNKPLHDRIVNNLQCGWSPGAISGRLRYEQTEKQICAESIYQFIYSKEGQCMELYKFLVRKHPERKVKCGRKSRTEIIPNRISIEQRPEHINQRLEIGHMETDLVFCNGSQSENILTSVDRKTRYVILDKNTNKKALFIANSFMRAAKRNDVPIKSSTFDNGLEFARHTWLCMALKIQTFFCKPHSPWQKGQIENTNGRLRYFIPKQANMRTFSEQRIQEIQDLMNNQPRRCLGYRTPKEVLCEEKSKLNGGYCCV